MERGRSEPHDPGEQVGEKPLGVAQEGALALHPTELLEQRERDNLGVPEPLYGLVASSAGVERRVGIVDEAEQDSQGLFRSGKPLGMVGAGHPSLLREGRLRWPPFYSQSTQHTSSAGPKQALPFAPLHIHAPPRHVVRGSSGLEEVLWYTPVVAGGPLMQEFVYELPRIYLPRRWVNARSLEETSSPIHRFSAVSVINTLKRSPLLVGSYQRSVEAQAHCGLRLLV